MDFSTVTLSRAVRALGGFLVTQPPVLRRGELAQQLLSGLSQKDIVAYWERRGVKQGTCLAALRRLQTDVVLTAAKRLALVTRCRNWLYGEYAQLEEPLDLPAVTDRIPGQEFRSRFLSLHRPLLVVGAGIDWPAVAKWSDEYLTELVGGVHIQVMCGRSTAPASDQYAGTALARDMPFGDFIAQVAAMGRSNDYYMVAKNDFFSREGAQALAADVGALDFVDTACSSSDTKLWFGPSGTYTPFHYDSRSSVLVQIRGVKRVRLISPWYSEHIPQSEPWYADPGWSPRGDEPVRIPVGVVLLKPGDALFIPVGWWHDVEALDISISMTFLRFK
jgi:Cupin-like domain